MVNNNNYQVTTITILLFGHSYQSSPNGYQFFEKHSARAQLGPSNQGTDTRTKQILVNIHLALDNTMEISSARIGKNYVEELNLTI